MKTTLIVLFLAVVAALFAQTAVTVTRVPQTQLLGEATATGSIWITLPDGTPRQAIIEMAYWELILPVPGSGAPPILRPKPMDGPSPVQNPILQRVGKQIDSSGNLDGREYQLTEKFVSGTLKLFRNGLRQTEGVDYSVIDDRTFVFVTHYAGDPDALIIADYKHDPQL